MARNGFASYTTLGTTYNPIGSRSRTGATVNPWGAFLEDNPFTLYNAIKPTGSNNFTDYWNNKYNDVYSGYLGSLGQQAIGGQSPNLSFTDYLKDYPFLNEWLKLSPTNRGQMGAGNARWIV